MIILKFHALFLKSKVNQRLFLLFLSGFFMKQHGNASNKNAQKEVKKEAFIKVRCLPIFRNRIIAAAQKHNFKNMSVLVLTAIEEKIDKLNQQ